jgi:hypothetical protein
MNELKTHRSLNNEIIGVLCCVEQTDKQARARASGVIAESAQFREFSVHTIQSQAVARTT